jgi:soluble lytic murein transglycosylase-like protein
MKSILSLISRKIPSTIVSLIRVRLSYLKLASFFVGLLLFSSLSFNSHQNKRLAPKAFVNLKTFGPRMAKPIGDVKYGSFKNRVLITHSLRLQKNRIKRKGKRFHDLIVRTANRHNVDPSLIKAIIMAESGYNPRAQSIKGAQGLMQLMPETAALLGVTDGFNPEENIRGGVKYFKMLLESFDGDIKLALAAYNAGRTKVKEYGGVPPFNATKIYIWKVFEYQKIYRDEMEKLADVA